MPEGDTLHQAAAKLRPALLGRVLQRVELRHLRGFDRLKVGDTVTAVESRGKCLEITVDRGFVLRTHLRMSGAWHLYAAGERWRRPRHLARVVLATDEAEAVCFSAPVVQVGRVGDGRLDHLGPDLCEPDPDLDAVLARVDALADPRTGIADVLLDQRLAAGIGNVYKSETLFACGIDPFRRLAEVTPDERRTLYETAHRLLRANLDDVRRTTVAGGLAVYDRAGRPCRVCNTTVRAREQGPQGRRTWWCPRCQEPAAMRSAPST